MKIYIKILLGASVIGGILAFLFYRDINSDVKAITQKEDVIYLLQVGVFNVEDNAVNFAEGFQKSIVYRDGEYFRVIVGVATNEEVKIKLAHFFENLGINYYIKETRVNKTLIDELARYEVVLLKSEKEDVIYNVNESMLKTFLTYLD